MQTLWFEIIFLRLLNPALLSWVCDVELVVWRFWTLHRTSVPQVSLQERGLEVVLQFLRSFYCMDIVEEKYICQRQGKCGLFFFSLTKGGLTSPMAGR